MKHEPEMMQKADQAPPPREFYLETGSKDVAKRIGIRFDGKIRPNDVRAYSVIEGWIELNDKAKTILHGVVEPFWRHAPGFNDQTTDQAQAALSAAEAKRMRRAERNRRLSQ